MSSTEGYYTDAEDQKQDRELHDPLLADGEARTTLSETAVARAVADGVPFLEAEQMYSV